MYLCGVCSCQEILRRNGRSLRAQVSMPYERMVANELVELAWVEEGENWMDETMDDKVSIITPPAHRYPLRSSVQAAPRSSWG
jgi:hypothetical protein